MQSVSRAETVFNSIVAAASGAEVAGGARPANQRRPKPASASSVLYRANAKGARAPSPVRAAPPRAPPSRRPASRQPLLFLLSASCFFFSPLPCISPGEFQSRLAPRPAESPPPAAAAAAGPSRLRPPRPPRPPQPLHGRTQYRCIHANGPRPHLRGRANLNKARHGGNSARNAGMAAAATRGRGVPGDSGGEGGGALDAILITSATPRRGALKYVNESGAIRDREVTGRGREPREGL